MAKPGLDSVFADWKEREARAEAMIPMIGSLYRRNVVVYIHGMPLFNQSVIELMKAHRWVRQIAKNEMSEFETYPILEILCSLDLSPVHVDIGKLTSTFMALYPDMSAMDYLQKMEEYVTREVGIVSAGKRAFHTSLVTWWCMASVVSVDWQPGCSWRKQAVDITWY